MFTQFLYRPTQLDNIAGITDNEPTMTCDNSELYSHTTHINTTPFNTVPLPGEYSVITDKEQLAGYSVIDNTNKMNRFHETLGVLHIVELAPWLCFAEGALQLKPTWLQLKLH